MVLRNAAVLLVPALTCACGGGAAAPAAGATLPGLTAAFGLPRIVAADLMASRSMVVEAVYRASALSGATSRGAVTSTGTLAVDAQGEPRWVATPGDRLVVELGGAHHEFVLRSAQGDNTQGSAVEWLSRPHTLSYHHEVKGGPSAEVDVQFDGTRFWVHVAGDAAYDGGKVEIDLVAEGASQGVGDLDGADRTTQYACTGTLQGDGFAVEVRETQSIRFASATSLRLLPGQRGAASSATTRIDSLLRSGDAEYQFDGVQVRSDYAEKGGRVRNQETHVQGAVLHGRSPFGDCSLVDGVPVLITTAGRFRLGA
ncbi:MAG: hypothetical protein U1F36_13980 [Planctomycetota bacterium]